MCQAIGVLFAKGQDWRSLAEVGRPVFMQTIWMCIVVLPLLAANYASASLGEEWSRRTIETLCATPMSFAAIVAGKFIASVGKVFLIGLGILPILGVALQIGRVPPELAAGCLGLAGATIAQFGALAMAAAAFRGPKEKKWYWIFGVIVFLSLPALLGIFVLQNHPLLVAAVPWWAFYHVSNWTAPRSMSPDHFALLAVGETLGVAVLAFLISPVLFRVSFARHITGARRRNIFKRRHSRRPPLRPFEDPLMWQERGGASQILRYGFWAPLAAAGLVTLIVAVYLKDMSIFSNSQYYLFVAMAAAAVLPLLSLFYSIRVFAREKEGRTAEALVLTGNAPGAFYLAKLQVILRGLIPSFVGIVCLVGLYFYFGGYSNGANSLWLLLIIPVGLFGPVCAGIVGLSFSAAARSPRQAWVALMVLPFFASFLGCLAFPVILIAVIVFLTRKSARTWGVWQLSFLLYATQMGVFFLLSFLMFIPGLVISFVEVGEIWWFAFWVLAVLFVAVAANVFWFILSLRIFERSMLNESEKTS
jgi:ABC-type transport system involved in multi-copper enzyme maturation permease subunit